MKETVNNLKRVYQFGKDYKISLFFATFFSFAFIIVNVVYPIFTAKQLTALTGSDFYQLIIASFIVLIFAILGALRMFIIRKNTQIFFRGTFKKLQLAVSREILKIKISDLDENSSGVFIERLNKDCNELSHIFTMGVGNLTGILSNIGVFIAIFIINKWIFIFYLLTSLIVTLLHLRKVKRVNYKDSILRDQQEKNVGLTGELVRGVRDIKMLNCSSSFIDEIENSINAVSNKTFDMRNTEMKYNLIISSVTAIIEFILIIILIYLIKINNINVATAVVLFSYRSNVMTNLMEKVGNLLTEIKSFNLSSKRVFAMFDETEFKKERFGIKHLDNVKGNFEFKNVTFSYDGKRKVLDKLSFKVKENETIGFVGKSGVGKTTIFNLLCKMYDVNKGKILIDGVNINELDEESIRGNITIISQNPYIFNLSIRDNLRLVKSDLTDEEMIEACKLASLHDFIVTLPDGYDTVVGEGGVTLSGGQRQRLAIARAFIQKTEIILFDEATSALDNDTQNKIQEAINNLKNEYTILIIAHRFSTIINCDRIYFIEDGKVIATGTHNELLKNCSSYKKLYESEIKLR